MRDKYTEIVKGVTAIQVGGHFEGSMVLHWDGVGEEGGEEQGGHLFIADTFVNVPVSLLPLSVVDPMFKVGRY